MDEHAAEEREFLADEYDSGAEHAAEDLRTLLKADEDDSDEDDFAAAEEGRGASSGATGDFVFEDALAVDTGDR